LTEKYDLPVYPVVIYSHNSPRFGEPNQYEVSFHDRMVLRFEYTVVQLNLLSWRDFVDSNNPVASALMARMRVSKEERPKVKLECLRLLSRLELDPARSTLIGGFIDSYLKLTKQEMKQYEREFAELTPTEREATMALVSSWEQKGIELGIERGIERGIEQGKNEVIVRQIRHRFG